MQGKWIVESLTDGHENSLAEIDGQIEIRIEGNIMTQSIWGKSVSGPIVFTLRDETIDQPIAAHDGIPIEMTFLPDGESETFQGILRCDGQTLAICTTTEAEQKSDFRPRGFFPGLKVTLWKCKRSVKNKTALQSELLGRWEVKNFIQGGLPSIANGRAVDPDGELARLFSEAIEHEDLITGPWILEIRTQEISLRHGPSKFPLWSFDAKAQEDGSFSVAIPKAALNSPISPFLPELVNLTLGGQYRIDQDRLRLCITQLESNEQEVKLDPNADQYFECVRKEVE